MNTNILTESETLDKLIAGYSIARYGDGEIVLCCGHSIGFQKQDEELKKMLQDLVSFKLHHEKLLIGLPPFIFGKFDGYTAHCVNYWKIFVKSKQNNIFIKSFLNKNKIYASSFITRISELTEKKTIMEKFKKIWENKKLLYLISEPNKKKMENKFKIMFDNVASLEFLYISHTNAWTDKKEILDNVVSKYDTSYVILCSGGPTATALAYDLTIKGYQFIDFGHFLHLL